MSICPHLELRVFRNRRVRPPSKIWPRIEREQVSKMHRTEFVKCRKPWCDRTLLVPKRPQARKKGSNGTTSCRGLLTQSASDALSPLTFLSIRIFVGGWISQATTLDNARTCALLTGSAGRSGIPGCLSSRNSRVARLCVITVPSDSTRLGTNLITHRVQW